MPKQKLTHSIIKGLKPSEKRVDYYDDLVKGLILSVTATGHKSFSYRYRQPGSKKIKQYTIGVFDDISLATARDQVRRLKQDVRAGADPLRDRQKRRNRPSEKTVRQLAEEFKRRHIPKLKPSTRAGYKNRINNEIIPSLGDIPARDLERADIIELLEDIAFERGKHTHSNRVRAILSSMYSFGMDKAIVEYNPVQTVKPVGQENSRERVYTEKEIRKIWKAIDGQMQPIRSLFKFLLITGQRSGETRRTSWKHVKGDTWVIPKELTKANREQYLPLSDMAIAELKRIKQITGVSDWVFASPLKANAPVEHIQYAAKRIRKASKVSDFRVHDLRRTAASYMAEIGVERTVLGKVLNHKGLAGDSSVTAIYDRHNYIEEKKAALQRWGYKLEQILAGKGRKTNILKIS